MTEKENFRAEIKRQIAQWKICHSTEAKYRLEMLKDILSFIDSMQEEPTTSVWHDANTLPSDPNAAIVEHNEYSTSICRAEQMSRVKGAKWAYVEDLLKL